MTHALRRVVEAPTYAEKGADDLCCGHLGRVEVLPIRSIPNWFIEQLHAEMSRAAGHSALP